MSPQTKRNIEKAMAVEALASAKYTRFAACALTNENPEVARLFQTAADIDHTAHFRKEFDLDTGQCDDRENLEPAIEDKESLIEV
jgi:rubrerythrin